MKTLAGEIFDHDAPPKDDGAAPYYFFLDFETDPFKFGRVPLVFAAGIYDPQTGDYFDWWGTQEECIEFVLDIFSQMPDGAIGYAHNGGKFDFHYFKEWLHGSITIIGARIVECRVGNVVLRDSYAMIPVALGKYQKTEIDYALFEADVREQHKDKILSYLKDDCVFLSELVMAFIAEFGIALTMASAAMREFRKFHDYEKLTSDGGDEKFRNFYYGGRVECFEHGMLAGNFKVYDVNSMYPAVMRDFEHPISKDTIQYVGNHANKQLENCDFAIIDAYSDGALPYITEDKGTLSFNPRRGRFWATGHEIRAGLETDRLIIHNVVTCYRATKRASFAEFVDHFYHSRQQAKADGNKLLDLFYKLVMNSSYGKFAQNPEKFKEWILTREIFDIPSPDNWCHEYEFPDNDLRIYSRPSPKPNYLGRYNVMTAASITGAARAQLLRGIAASERPVYCDTDSLICETFNGDVDPGRLGAWKPEAEGTVLAIGGKKMYCLFDKDGAAIKLASKGVRLTPKDLVDIANGATVTHQNDAPTFNISKQSKFIVRKIKSTWHLKIENAKPKRHNRSANNLAKI